MRYSRVTKKEILYWLYATELTGNEFFIKKLGPGHYRISFDRAKHLRKAADTLGAYFGVKHGPSVRDMWIEVMPKSKLYGTATNPRRRRYRVGSKRRSYRRGRR